MSTFASATEIAALAGARRPNWLASKLSTLLAAAPVNLNEGWLVLDAVYAHLHVTCRESPGVRVAYVSVPDFDAATTYTVTIDGTTYSANEATETEVLEELIAQVDAVTGLSAAEADEGTDAGGRDHTDAEVRITGGRSYGASVSGGTGTIALVADAQGAIVQMFAMQEARLGTTAPRAWVAYGEPFHVPPEGASRLVRVGGIERLSVRAWVGGHVADGLLNTSTTALVSCGPALTEG